MASAHNYTRLPDVRETQDIADANQDSYDTHSILQRLDSDIELRPLSFSTSAASNEIYQRAPADRASLETIDTFDSPSSSGFSKGKIKNFAARIRRKPLPNNLFGSIRRQPAANIEPTRIGPGVWKDQLLVDRSLRTMAATMTLFAVAMIILIATHAKFFSNRSNRNTSSVGGDTGSCETVTTRNTVFLLLINVCATMILGMSNTYQQLVTSLKVSDLKHMLSEFGDSRVGTNSPFNINHKREGKKSAWASWIFLILTSMPIHFLANSLIGPSYVQELPDIVEFNEVNNLTWASSRYDALGGSYEEVLSSDMSFPCWAAFRTGKPHYPQSTEILESYNGPFGSQQDQFGKNWKRIQVHYDRVNCSQHARTAKDLFALEMDLKYAAYGTYYVEGNCELGANVLCTLHDSEQAKCRLNVRLSAAFILASCLILKATYMCTVNLLARGKLKTHCLTFGDVVVASASHTELRVQGECMVNAGDNYRRKNTHICHKHCKSEDDSKTGDEIGHCQKCKKWNSTDKFSNQPQPTIATKFKKGLLSNLGNTALTQMSLLVFCSFVLVGASIAIAVPLGMSDTYMRQRCKTAKPGLYPECDLPSTERFAKMSGGFGGFNRSLTLTSMSPDSLSNEFLSFSISNGAQFIYSLLYLMMIYNITLVSQERDWGNLEHMRKRIRCTIVEGDGFSQDYLLQLPKRILFPIMIYSVLTHWMLGEALQTQEAIWLEDTPGHHLEHSKYIITYAAYPLWIATFLIMLMTGVCWWAFTYKREGFIPQMFGSIRTLCAATTQLDDFPSNGLQWGDLGEGKQFRHAGLTAEKVGKIVPNELYADATRKIDDKMYRH